MTRPSGLLGRSCLGLRLINLEKAVAQEGVEEVEARMRGIQMKSAPAVAHHLGEPKKSRLKRGLELRHGRFVGGVAGRAHWLHCLCERNGQAQGTGVSGVIAY